MPPAKHAKAESGRFNMSYEQFVRRVARNFNVSYDKLLKEDRMKPLYQSYKASGRIPVSGKPIAPKPAKVTEFNTYVEYAKGAPSTLDSKNYTSVNGRTVPRGEMLDPKLRPKWPSMIPRDSMPAVADSSPLANPATTVKTEGEIVQEYNRVLTQVLNTAIPTLPQNVLANLEEPLLGVKQLSLSATNLGMVKLAAKQIIEGTGNIVVAAPANALVPAYLFLSGGVNSIDIERKIKIVDPSNVSVKVMQDLIGTNDRVDYSIQSKTLKNNYGTYFIDLTTVAREQVFIQIINVIKTMMHHKGAAELTVMSPLDLGKTFNDFVRILGPDLFEKLFRTEVQDLLTSLGEPNSARDVDKEIDRIYTLLANNSIAAIPTVIQQSIAAPSSTTGVPPPPPPPLTPTSPRTPMRQAGTSDNSNLPFTMTPNMDELNQRINEMQERLERNRLNAQLQSAPGADEAGPSTPGGTNIPVATATRLRFTANFEPFPPSPSGSEALFQDFLQNYKPNAINTEKFNDSMNRTIGLTLTGEPPGVGKAVIVDDIAGFHQEKQTYYPKVFIIDAEDSEFYSSTTLQGQSIAIPKGLNVSVVRYGGGQTTIKTKLKTIFPSITLSVNDNFNIMGLKAVDGRVATDVKRWRTWLVKVYGMAEQAAGAGVYTGGALPNSQLGELLKVIDYRKIAEGMYIGSRRAYMYKIRA